MSISYVFISVSPSRPHPLMLAQHGPTDNIEYLVGLFNHREIRISQKISKPLRGLKKLINLENENK